LERLHLFYGDCMAKERKKSSRKGSARDKSIKVAKRSSGVPVDRDPDGPGGFGPHNRPEVVVTVDVVLLALRNGELSTLLVERGREPHQGAWALPGSVVESGEKLVPAAVRAVAGRTGVAVEPERLEQLATFADPDRDPRTRVLSVGFIAVVERATPPAGGDVASGRWWAVDDVLVEKGPTTAFDHRDILRAGVEVVAEKFERSDLAISMIEAPFTLGELRRAYETVWGASLEPANFRRKILATPSFVEPTGLLRGVTTGRPAELYRRGRGIRLHPPLVRPR
jgi:8-oxo-dGTP diphosphatase